MKKYQLIPDKRFLPVYAKVSKTETLFPNILKRSLAVVSSVTPWNEPPRIRHQITRQLTRFYNVLYIQLPFGSDSQEDQFEQINEHLLIFRPKKIHRTSQRLWANFHPFHSFYNKKLVKKIDNAIQAIGYTKAVLINFQFNFPEIMLPDTFITKIYLCNDEFPDRTKWSWKRRQLKEYEDQVASNSDACIAVSLPLLDKLKKLNRNARLLLPGHEFDVSREPAVMRYFSGRKRPIRVCFMGYINERIRFDWLLELVKIEEFDVTLIGPVQRDSRLSELLAYPNFKVAPRIEGSDLHEALSMMDVLIIPYDTKLKSVQAITASNKFFQYLACGKPIVISDMPHFIDLADKCIYRARDAKEFIECIRRAYDEDCEEYIRRRIEIAEQNSWDSRGNELMRMLQSLHEVDISESNSMDLD